MDNAQAIATLNTLIETCKNGEEGFRTAAEGVKDEQTKTAFREFSAQRAGMVRDLQQEVRSLGGDPETTGTISGSAHRGWMNIKSLVTGGDDASIIAEAERGEDIAKEAYEKALKEGLPPTSQAVVREQAARVKAAHDRVRAMEKSRTGR